MSLSKDLKYLGPSPDSLQNIVYLKATAFLVLYSYESDY